MTTLRQPSESIVDVRSIIPRERHPLIFNTFSSLEPGQGFVLVNDHDPKPLYYQFQAEHEGPSSGITSRKVRCLARPHWPNGLS